mgnify:CR=1 FL=1
MECQVDVVGCQRRRIQKDLDQEIVNRNVSKGIGQCRKKVFEPNEPARGRYLHVVAQSTVAGWRRLVKIKGDAQLGWSP